MSYTDAIPSVADLSPVEMWRVIDQALAEDLASGDATTRAVVPVDATAFGRLNAREPMVLAGVGVAGAVFSRVDSSVKYTVLQRDGARLDKGAVVAEVEGPAHSVLVGERVALNLLQRLCGTASRTAQFVAAIPPGSRTRVTDTRKTTPGLRALERYAVRCGGGHNHRNDLGSGILIKDNHIVVCGGVRAAIERARASASHTLRIEIEVDRESQFEEALDAGADVIMLDNFDDARAAAVIARIQDHPRRPIIELSGGVTLERMPAIAALGVDVVSVGSLTHGARSMDIGLDLELRV
ncbi:MAG: carboxylating nicotinate-nucleotide diphosphorylase [Deltaproteobacteria bacterium]|nr:carboxylating nicotinate-nucleotide diphosphorylase [Deltaproteobacteria bacterium]